jgi:hypothetical protein
MGKESTKGTKCWVGVTCAVGHKVERMRADGFTNGDLEETRLFSHNLRRILTLVCECAFFLDNVQCVEHEDIMVVFGKCHHKSFGCYLESTAAGDLDVWTLKLGKQWTIAREYSNMEAVSMWISDKYVTGVWYVNPIGKVSDWLASNSTDVFTLFIEYHHTVTLNQIMLVTSLKFEST